MVSPEKQIWHDFSSNQGGDIFSFVMLMEGIDFRGALEILARKAGVDLSQYGQGDSQASKRKEKIIKVNELATRYYHASLVKNKSALDYVVNKRGYGKAILETFKIGYAPKTGNALSNFLVKKGYKKSDLKDAGLVSANRDYDMFRERIVIPLADGQGRIVGFTARVMNDSLPKYINSPQTLVYDKGRQVFGLHLAKEAIREKDYVVIVEGNLDVIASHKTSVKNVVATAGTALTKDHLKQLSRLSKDVRLAFDQDSAGVAATERSIPIAQEVDVRLSIIDIKEGKDPDELIKKNPKAWESSVEKSIYVMDWLIERYREEYDLKTAEGKRQFSDKVLMVLARVKDPIEQEHYLRLIADLTGVDFKTVKRKLEQSSVAKRNYRTSRKVETLTEKKDSQSAYQDLLLGLNMLHPDLQHSLKGVNPVDMEDEKRQKVMSYIKNNLGKVISSVPQDLLDLEDYVKIVLFKTEELYDDWSSSDRLIEAIGLARRLHRDKNQKQKNILSVEIRKAEQAGDDNKRQALLKKFDQLLKENK
jgi:DNA primase